MKRWNIYHNDIREGSASTWHKALKNILNDEKFVTIEILKMLDDYVHITILRPEIKVYVIKLENV